MAALQLTQGELEFATDKDDRDSPQWNIRKINVPKVWSMDGVNGKGAGVVYANADTGVSYNHPLLNTNYRGKLANGSYDHNYSIFCCLSTTF